MNRMSNGKLRRVIAVESEQVEGVGMKPTAILRISKDDPLVEPYDDTDVKDWTVIEMETGREFTITGTQQDAVRQLMGD